MGNTPVIISVVSSEGPLCYYFVFGVTNIENYFTLNFFTFARWQLKQGHNYIQSQLTSKKILSWELPFSIWSSLIPRQIWEWNSLIPRLVWDWDSNTCHWRSEEVERRSCVTTISETSLHQCTLLLCLKLLQWRLLHRRYDAFEWFGENTMENSMHWRALLLSRFIHMSPPSCW